MPHSFEQTADETQIERLKALAKAMGPFTTEGIFIWAQSEKGGKTPIADIRGWGYLTGKGQGALGLTDDEALERQRHWANMIVESLNRFSK